MGGLDQRVAVRRRARVAAALVGAMVAGLAGTVPAQAAAGDLDTTFGAGNGVSRWSVNVKEEYVRAATLQPDGKIVVATQVKEPAMGSFDQNWAMSRLNLDGSLDTGFGAAGTSVIDLGYDFREEPRDLAVQDDGKIVVAGWVSSGGTFDTALVRLNADGSLDSGFGTGGVVIQDNSPGRNDDAQALVIAPTGRILVAGQVSPGPGVFDFAVTAFDANGTLDTAFGGGDGVFTKSISTGSDWPRSMALQTDGSIVVAGQGGGNFALLRLQPTGVLDSSFGTGGKVVTDFGGSNDVALDVAIDANGRVVAAGFGGYSTSSKVALARYTTSGALDGAFGAGGKATTTKLKKSQFVTATDVGVAIQPDGKPVVGGGFNGLNGADFGAARFTTSGFLDTTFSGDGVVKFDLFADQDYGSDVAIDSAGGIVVVGGVDASTQNPDGSHDGESMVVRFLGELAASACPGLTITNTIVGTPGPDTLVGTAGSDLIIGGSGDDDIDGGGGDDCVYGGTGDDAIVGGTGDDRVFSEAGDDVIRLAAGDVPAASSEALKGKGGADTLELGAGLGTADVNGGPPTFTVTDPSTGGTYSAIKIETVVDT